MPKRTGIMKLMDVIPDLFENRELVSDFLNPRYGKSRVVRKGRKK